MKLTRRGRKEDRNKMVNDKRVLPFTLPVDPPVIPIFSQIKHFISNEDDVKISFKRFFRKQICSSTGRGDFNNSPNVTHTQIQLMMMI